MVHSLGDSKMSDFDPPIRGLWFSDHKDIAWLEVAVNKALAVHDAETIKQISGYVLHFILRDGLSDVAFEITQLEVLHIKEEIRSVFEPSQELDQHLLLLILGLREFCQCKDLLLVIYSAVLDQILLHDFHRPSINIFIVPLQPDFSICAHA